CSPAARSPGSTWTRCCAPTPRPGTRRTRSRWTPGSSPRTRSGPSRAWTRYPPPPPPPPSPNRSRPMPDISKITSGLQRRDLTAPLQLRESDEGGKREVSGIGVPYNDPIEIFGVREEFAPGSVEADDEVMLFWRHTDPIGLVTS